MKKILFNEWINKLKLIKFLLYLLEYCLSWDVASCFFVS